MSVTTYNRGKKYEIGELQPWIYLINKDTTIDYVIDNGEVFVKRVNGIVHKVYGSLTSLTSEETINGRFKFNNSVEFIMKETQISSLMDVTKFFRDDEWKIIVEDKTGNHFIMNLDFYAHFEYLYNIGTTNECTFTFSTDSNFPTLFLETKLIEINTVYERPCLYNNGKFDELMLCDFNNAYIIQDEINFTNVRYTGSSGFNKIDYLKNSAQFQEQFDGTNYTQAIKFVIPLSEYKSYWQYSLIEFTQNKYVALISTTNNNVLASGFENGYFPSYTIETSDAPGTLNTITINLVSVSKRPLVYQSGNIDDTIKKDDNITFVNVNEYYYNDILYKGYDCYKDDYAKRILFQEITSTGEKLNRYWVHIDYQHNFDGTNINIVGTFDDNTDMGIPLTFRTSMCNTDVVCEFKQVPEENIILTEENKQITFNVEAACDWRIINIPDWLEINTTEGVGGDIVEVSLNIKENIDNTQLSSNITISMSEQYYTFTVTYLPTIIIEGEDIESCDWYDMISFDCQITNTGRTEGYTQAGGSITMRIKSDYMNEFGLSNENVVWTGSSFAYIERIQTNNTDFKVILPANNSGSNRRFKIAFDVLKNDGKRFICDGEEKTQFTFFEMTTVETGYVCEDGNKYQRWAVYQGQTLDNINTLVYYTKGNLIEENSLDCVSDIEYRYVETTNTMCEGSSQYYVEEQQMRIGDGEWKTTGVIQRGKLIENGSPDCDSHYKWEDSGIFECDGRAQYQVLAKLYDNGDGVWRDTGERKRGKLIHSFSSACEESTDSTISLTFEAFYKTLNDSYAGKTIYLTIEAVGEWQINWGDGTNLFYLGNESLVYTYNPLQFSPFIDNPLDREVKIGGNIKRLSIEGYNQPVGTTEKTSTILKNADWSKATSLEKLHIFRTVRSHVSDVYPQMQAKMDLSACVNLKELYIMNWTYGSYTSTIDRIFVPPVGNNLEKIDILRSGELRSGGFTPRFASNEEFKSYFCKPCIDGNRTFVKPCIINLCPHIYNDVQLGCGADFSDMYAEGWFVSLPCCTTNGAKEYQYAEGTSTTCIGFDKWSIGTLQERTYTNGSWGQWKDVEGVVIPYNLIETNSTDCGYEPPIEPQYRWEQSVEYMCDGVDSYYIEYEQISRDNGASWSNTGTMRKGSLRKQNDTMCGYFETQYQYRWVEVEDEYVCEEE